MFDRSNTGRMLIAIFKASVALDPLVSLFGCLVAHSKENVVQTDGMDRQTD